MTIASEFTTPAVITAAVNGRCYVTNATVEVSPGPCVAGPVVELHGRKLRLCKVDGITRRVYVPASKVKAQ